MHARAQSRAEPYVVKIEGDVEYTHDPAIIKDSDTWYLFGATTDRTTPEIFPFAARTISCIGGGAAMCSPASRNGSRKRVPETKELWAPDVSYFNGE